MGELEVEMLLVLALLMGCQKDRDDVPIDTVVIPDPQELQVGIGRTRMPVPIGIGTIGNNGLGVSSDPSPFADALPATTRLHGHPTFKAVVISRAGPHEVIFLRSDRMNVFQHVRLDLANELERRLGRNVNDSLILGATHTHSGPGRMVNADGVLELGFGKYSPEFYDNMIDAMADAVEQAYDTLAPGRVGHVLADVGDAIKDRRCEDGNPDYTNSTMPVLAVEQEGELIALVGAVAVHGTVIGIDELTISSDVSGAIEAAIEDGFSTDVQVQVHNSWGADMRPNHPEVSVQTGYTGMPGGYDQMDAVGQKVAEAVHSALSGLELESEPAVWAEIHGVETTRDAIGYESDEFKWEYGGLYCGPQDEDCDINTDYYDTFDDVCVPLPEEYVEFGIQQTEMSVGRVGDLHLVTWPGEGGTKLAEKVMDALATNYSDVDDVMFVGYAQDYNGYSILEDDYWQGGYEASGAMWGPLQGAYLSDQLIRIFGLYKAGKRGPEPAPVNIPDQLDYAERVSTTPVDVGGIITDVQASYTEVDLVTFSVRGTDPWEGAPVAHLESGAGSPVLRPNGLPVTSDGQGFWVDLTVDPPYERDDAIGTREFQWHFNMPVARQAVGAGPTLSGEYRLRVVIPNGGSESEAVSAVFDVQ